MQKALLVINLGSSSLKFALFTVDEKLSSPLPNLYGKIDAIDSAPHFLAKTAKGAIITEQQAPYKPSSREPQHNAFSFFLSWLKHYAKEFKIIAVGHRIVHGGALYTEPTIINVSIVEQLKAFNSVAPDHQPYNLTGVSVLQELLPHALHVACFDTAFHANMPLLAQTFAIPAGISTIPLKRYGFHGLSYDYITSALPKHLGQQAASGKIIIAHLGHGASMCALHNSQSIATTMGFSALDGLPMATRCGSIDPGVILYLLQNEKMTVDEIATLLYKKSGLLGISGISSDLRDLLNNNAAHAKTAVDFFIYRIVSEIGSLTAILKGLDNIIFTAGIGENNSIVRQKVCAQLTWLGVDIDEEANLHNQLKVSKATSKINIFVIPTNEELVIANYTHQLWKAV